MTLEYKRSRIKIRWRVRRVRLWDNILS